MQKGRKKDIKHPFFDHEGLVILYFITLSVAVLPLL